MDLKERLLNERQRSGLTQRQAESLSGISRTSIFRYEQGAEAPLSAIEKLAIAYNISPIVLAGWEKYITVDLSLAKKIRNLSEAQLKIVENLIDTFNENK